jgi:hypothetical protein
MLTAWLAEGNVILSLSKGGFSLRRVAIVKKCAFKIGSSHAGIITWIDYIRQCDTVYIYNFPRRNDCMRMELEGTLLKMTPENDREKQELNQLWTIIIGCVSEGKRLVPVGEYLPGIKEVAVFNIE